MTPTRRQSLTALAAAAAATTLPGCASPPAAALPAVDVGRLERLSSVPSRHVPPRHVDVWLPPGFRADGSHAVLYLHDGQMLFDAATTWNRQAWDVHRTAGRLMTEGRVRPFIVVGAWNGGPARFAEYYPQGFLARVPAGPSRDLLLQRAVGGQPVSDAYLRFLVEELRPAIELRFGTARGPSATFIGGSSMGGMISMYALCEYPEVFGGAACLSTHWIGLFERNDDIPAGALAYLRERLPAPGRHRLYLDRGTADLDAQYDVAHARVDTLLAQRGWGPPALLSRVFEGEGHNERAWAGRLHLPLMHLLGA